MGRQQRKPSKVRLETHWVTCWFQARDEGGGFGMGLATHPVKQPYYWNVLPTVHYFIFILKNTGK